MKLIKLEKPGKVEIFVAPGWKRKLDGRSPHSRKEVRHSDEAAMADAEIKRHAAEVAKVLMSYMKNASALGETMDAEFEMEALLSAKKMLGAELGAEISVSMEEKSVVPKAKNALPGKPSITIS